MADKKLRGCYSNEILKLFIGQVGPAEPAQKGLRGVFWEYQESSAPPFGVSPDLVEVQLQAECL